MAHFLVYSTRGSESAATGVAPFYFAKGILEAGHTVEIWLIGDATYLAKETGLNNVRELMNEVATQGVKIMVLDTSGSWRDVKPEDLKKKNAKFGTSRMFAEAVLAADKVVGF